MNQLGERTSTEQRSTLEQEVTTPSNAPFEKEFVMAVQPTRPRGFPVSTGTERAHLHDSLRTIHTQVSTSAQMTQDAHISSDNHRPSDNECDKSFFGVFQQRSLPAHTSDQSSTMKSTREKATGRDALDAGVSNAAAPENDQQNTANMEHAESTASEPVGDAPRVALDCRTIPVQPNKDQSSSVSPKSTQQERPRKRKLQVKPGQTTGRWTSDEHQAFLEGLKIFGREWKKVAERIKTRSSAQIRSHAQKYFSRLDRDESLSIDIEAQPPNPYNAIPPETYQQQLPASTQRCVERIIRDPSGTQQEVEDTLWALRERYRQLQQRLEERSRARLLLSNEFSDSGSVVEDDESQQPMQQYQEQHPPKRHVESLHEQLPSSTRRRLSSDDLDGSTVSSNLSSSLVSFSRVQNFGDDELLAVHVLGGTLPRSPSQQDDLAALADQTNSDATKKDKDFTVDAHLNGDEDDMIT